MTAIMLHGVFESSFCSFIYPPFPNLHCLTFSMPSFASVCLSPPPLVRYEQTPSIFNRNKSGRSPNNPTRAILQAYKYYHHPFSLLFRCTPHFPHIPCDLSESVYVIFHSLASLFHATPYARMHVCAILCRS